MESEQVSETNNDKNSTPSPCFLKSLCMGQIEEDMIIPFPQIKDDEKELLRELSRSVESWLTPYIDDFRKWDRQAELPEKVLNEMKEFGLFGLVTPEEFGGMGLSSSGYSRAIQEFSKYDGNLAITVGVHNSIGMKGLLLFGTEEQKKRYLERLASGKMIAAFCLTESGAGSDAASIRTKAVRDGEDWVLNGEKIWISNGGIAEYFTVFAKTDGPEGKMTAFIVTKEMEGVSVGAHEDKMGLRANTTTTFVMKNVRVPADHVLGPVGKGFKVAMTTLNSGRSGLGGAAIGGMKRLIELSCKQAKERKQFGHAIADYGLIKQKIGTMVADTYATEATVSVVAGMMDRGIEDSSAEAAISKIFASEALGRIADQALQIAGGNGYMCEFPYERAVRDARVSRIFEGSNEILRLFVALTAMRDVGAQLKELGKSVNSIFNHPIKGFGVLTGYALKRVTQVAGVGGKKTSFTKLHKALDVPRIIFEEGVKNLAMGTEKTLRKYGKNIIGEQFATGRLGDIMIDLFVLACVLARVNDSIEKNGLEKTKGELDIVTVFSGKVKSRVKRNFKRIDKNDDETVKAIADLALEHEAFLWDSI